MIWTKTPPDRPGWYWWRVVRLNYTACVRIVNRNGRLTSGAGPVGMFAESEHHLWSGPIPEPTEDRRSGEERRQEDSIFQFQVLERFSDCDVRSRSGHDRRQETRNETA